MTNQNKQPKSIQVIQRSAQLMEAIANTGSQASLKILSAETGLHPSTAYRILASLIEIGFVERDNYGHYYMGRKLSHLANSVRQDVDIREVSRDIMNQLRDEIGETVNLTVREGDKIIYIERAVANRMMRVEQVIGSRAPLHVTAVGKLMLGELGNTFIRAYSERTGLKAYTKHTLSKLDELIKGVHEATALGFAYDNEEAEIGVCCIGVLIHDNSGNVVAGLSISAPIERRQDEWVESLKQAAKMLSSKL
jgi:DNA-binding IclR family transcriptional regulator